MKNQIIILPNGKKVAIDRSVGVVLLVVTQKDGRTFILCNSRGMRTSECRGQWNLPSGYLDWDESGEEAAVRETFEECGINIPLSLVKEVEHSTKPTENRQNVIFRYLAIVPSYMMDIPLSSVNSEEDEVRDIKWVPVDSLDSYAFAWNQISTIRRILYNNDLENSK